MASGAIIPVIVRQAGRGQPYRIHGTVDELGAPGQYRVRLYDRQTGRLITQTRSRPDGTWSFDWIPYLDAGYFVTAHDHTDPLRNAAISDFITPEPIPDV